MATLKFLHDNDDLTITIAQLFLQNRQAKNGFIHCVRIILAKISWINEFLHCF